MFIQKPRSQLFSRLLTLYRKRNTVPAADRLYVAATQSNILSALYPAPAGQTACGIRYPFRIGSGARKNLVLAFNGWGLTSLGYVPIGHDVTIAQCYLEKPGGAGPVVQVTFGGQTSAVITDGMNDLQSDVLLPSQFGLTEFPVEASSWFVKMRLNFPSGGGLRYSDSRSNSAFGAGAQHWFYNPSVTTLSNFNGPGVLTRTGTAANNRDTGYTPVVLGAFTPAAHRPTYMTVGSSTAAGSADGKQSFSSGLFSRAMTITERPRAHLHWAATGSGTTGIMENPKVLYWLKYANTFVDQIGANSVDGLTFVNHQVALNDIWALARSNGVSKIVRSYYNPRTSSSDSFTTTAGQTPDTHWGVGSRADQLNQWFSEKVSQGVLDAVLPLTAFFAADAPRKWFVNGTPNYSTSDGQHAESALHVLAAAELDGILSTLEA